MRIRIPILLAFAMLASAAASAATFSVNDSLNPQTLTIAADGVLVIDNPFGNIDVVAHDSPKVMYTAQRIISGVDKAALAEARAQTDVNAGGDVHMRVIRTQVPLLHGSRWSSRVNFVVRVPASVQVRIVSNSADHIRVSGVRGAVSVKNWNGQVVLENLGGPALVDSLNGDISFSLATAPAANLQLTTVNGEIDLSLPAESAFRWIATTIKGDFLSTFPVSGRFNGTKYIAAVNNAPGGPTVATTSMMGNVFVLRRGTRQEQAQSARATAEGRRLRPQPQLEIQQVTALTTTPQTFQRPVVDGDFLFTTPLGNVSVGRVRGTAHVETRAGEVQLGFVEGQCDIVSLGGPITLGDIQGPLTARTSAGNISINSTRQGAVVSTGGGMIRILSAAGSTNLHSQGGDIVVHRAFGPVSAETRSGDVTVFLDAGLRSNPLDLKTQQGNVVLSVRSGFAADVDAVIVTSDPDSNAVHSDFAGLTIRREQINGKTRIHAFGKLNGGGEKVTLYAEEGDIHINAIPVTDATAER